jgi:transcriptional repressor NrdR
MRCPFCQEDNVSVIDTRRIDNDNVVKRRRVCKDCGQRFTTHEVVVEATQVRVIKQDNTREPFDRDKLRKGLERAVGKREISDMQISTLITQVEQDIAATSEREIQSRFIGERVMHYLGKLDQVAYVRFASVYRDFKDADDFIRELQRMKENPDMPCLSSEYLPKMKTSPLHKAKPSRYGEQDLLAEE